jgi:hypothetical protein
MATPTARTILDFALLQSAAECYLGEIKDYSSQEEILKSLQIGVNDPATSLPNDPVLPGATRFTQTQAEWFTGHYEIVIHYPSDASGFSCTLFKNKQA